MPCLRVPMPYTDDRNQFILKQKMLSDFNTYLNMFNIMWHAKLAFYIYNIFLDSSLFHPVIMAIIGQSLINCLSVIWSWKGCVRISELKSNGHFDSSSGLD